MDAILSWSCWVSQYRIVKRQITALTREVRHWESKPNPPKYDLQQKLRSIENTLNIGKFSNGKLAELRELLQICKQSFRYLDFVEEMETSTSTSDAYSRTRVKDENYNRGKSPKQVLNYESVKSSEQSSRHPDIKRNLLPTNGTSTSHQPYNRQKGTKAKNTTARNQEVKSSVSSSGNWNKTPVIVHNNSGFATKTPFDANNTSISIENENKKPPKEHIRPRVDSYGSCQNQTNPGHLTPGHGESLNQQRSLTTKTVDNKRQVGPHGGHGRGRHEANMGYQYPPAFVSTPPAQERSRGLSKSNCIANVEEIQNRTMNANYQLSESNSAESSLISQQASLSILKTVNSERQAGGQGLDGKGQYDPKMDCLLYSPPPIPERSSRHLQSNFLTGKVDRVPNSISLDHDQNHKTNASHTLLESNHAESSLTSQEKTLITPETLNNEQQADGQGEQDLSFVRNLACAPVTIKQQRFESVGRNKLSSRGARDETCYSEEDEYNAVEVEPKKIRTKSGKDEGIDYSTDMDTWRIAEEQCKGVERRDVITENAAERICSNVARTRCTGFDEGTGKNENINIQLDSTIGGSGKHEVYSHDKENRISSPNYHYSQNGTFEESNYDTREQNKSRNTDEHQEPHEYFPPEAEDKPLEILDVGQYFRNDLDLNSLDSLDYVAQIENIRTYAKSFKNTIDSFAEEKYSLEYFVLDEKLMRLIEKLDKIKCQDDEQLIKRKVEAIQYIKRLHDTLDQNAKDDE